MLVACWSPKGGSGTTVVACGLALTVARRSPQGALLVDLAGDVPAALGLSDAHEPAAAGVGEWLAAAEDVPAAALARLEVPVTGSVLRVLPRGADVANAARGDALAEALATDSRPVVVDCGRLESPTALTVAAAATVSLLVVRPCYLALTRALQAPLQPSAVVLVDEPRRALSRHDVEQVVGAPVRVELELHEGVARAVDAGLLASRLPRPLERGLRPVVELVVGSAAEGKVA